MQAASPRLSNLLRIGCWRRLLRSIWEQNGGTMLLFVLLAETAVKTPAAAPQVQARAAVRIERGVTTGPTEWKDAPLEMKREVVRKLPEGQTEWLRIVDYP